MPNTQNISKMKGKLYLIPNTLGNSPIDRVIPSYNTELINSIKYYIVENIRTARRFLSKSKIKTKIDDLVFFELNKHSSKQDYNKYLEPILLQGCDMGIISEAGCPAVADPGAEIVAIAHTFQIEVVPLVGPSSILLALMASGFNGQNFAFNGYLPIDAHKRTAAIKLDEQRSAKENLTQIYIETPYRNEQLLKAMLKTLKPTTKLCIAVDISLDSQQIISETVEIWKNININLHKRTAVFLLHA